MDGNHRGRQSGNDTDHDDYLNPTSSSWSHSYSSRRSSRSPNGPREAEASRLLQPPSPPPSPPHGSSASSSTTAVNQPEKEKPIGWDDLPKKSQLVLLVLARLSEPLTMTSIQAYMFYMLKSFSPSAPSSKISAQAGYLAGAFTFAQFLTAVLWGRLADHPRVGRKSVLIIGLFGSMLSVLGFGFSKSYTQAVVFRTLGGALNGNVGVMRAMTSEIVVEKKFQSRAFLLLPICFNIGVILGPIMGGMLAEPATTYPGVFGSVVWMQKYPYALPNIVSAGILMASVIFVFFGMDETLGTKRDKPDYGRLIGKKLTSLFLRFSGRHAKDAHLYHSVESRDSSLDLPEINDEHHEHHQKPIKKDPPRPKFTQKLPFLRIFTSNVLFTLLSHFLLGIHLGAFNNLWYLFLSTPVSTTPPHGLAFTGGLGMPPSHVGMAMAILGVLGIGFQLLFYPKIQAYFGLLKSFRIFLVFFIIAYTLVPFLALVPSTTEAPHEKTGILVWVAISMVLLVQVTGRTMVLPAIGILVNNCSPHPSVLGSVHGVGQSVGSLARSFGPVLGGYFYGRGLDWGVVGFVWWCMAGVAVLNLVSGFWVSEGSGWEIVLDGDEIEGKEENTEERRRNRDP